MKLYALTAITMVAFAGNSLLCRLALDKAELDPSSFTSIRILSGALVLWFIVIFSKSSSSKVTTEDIKQSLTGAWISAFSLFTYAACFSYAYVNLTTAMGALLLFSAVQATMIGHAIWSGDKLRSQQILGLFLALTGLTYLLWPGLSAPPIKDSIIMIISGIAWGVYSLKGRGTDDPSSVTTINFIKAVPFAVILSLATLSNINLSQTGIWAAIASGAITSALGYTLWYRVLPSLKSTTAATVQLSVPVIAAFAGVIFLNEAATLHMVLASVAIIGGIALVITQKQ